MRKLKNTLLAAALLACVTVTATVLAITYGQPDGNRHPNVGALVGTFSTGTFPYCSGTLISPTVFLTAAHCNVGTTVVYVTFDTEYSSHAKLHRGTFYYDPRTIRRRATRTTSPSSSSTDPSKGSRPRGCRPRGSWTA